MYSAVHSTPSAGPKQGYHASHLPHTRFSVHMYQTKPGFGGTAGYLSSGNGIDPSSYRGIQPPLNHSVYHQPRYEERYSTSVPMATHGHHVPTVPVPIPGRHPSPPHLSLSTGVSRGYEPVRTAQPPLQPSPPLPHSRGTPAPHHPHPASHQAPANKFSIYPSANAQNTFIYEQSLTSKSDIFSETDTDATSIMTYSPTESTATVGGDTPLASPLDAPGPSRPTTPAGAPVPSGIQRSVSRTGVPIPPQHQVPMNQYAAWMNPPHAIPQAAALMKTPSENSIDMRERIAIMNAKHNSASTGSYYSSSPPLSTDGTVPLQSQPSQYTAPPAASVTVPSSQPMFPDAFVQGSPEMYDRRTSPRQAPSVVATYGDTSTTYSADATYARSSPDSSAALPIRERKSSVSYAAAPTLDSSPSSYPDRDKDVRRRNSTESRSGREPVPQAQSTVPFISSSPPTDARDRYEGRESSRRDERTRGREREKEREREYERDKENRDRYPTSSSSGPSQMRSRTSSTSYGAGWPMDHMSGPPPPQATAAIPAKDDVSSERRPRHPDLAHGMAPKTSGAVPTSSRGSSRVDTDVAAPASRTRKMSFTPQLPETTMATVATAGTETQSSSSRYRDSSRDAPSAPTTQPSAKSSSSRRHSDAEKVVYERDRSERDKARERSPTHGSSSQQPNRQHETQRRYSDGDQKLPLRISTTPSRGGSRSVRWNDNLICPSPIAQPQKRVGWYNRRGDQLWTNDGVFKAAPSGQQYPADLDDYPEPGEGWMNEDGVTIDIEHRRIPKLPRRPALKHVRTN